MPPLARELRKVLEATVVQARKTAEEAAGAALSALAVDQDKPFEHLDEDDRRLRRALRAKLRQLGGRDALASEIAYQHWHRMLFARFLAENQLLMHPEAGIAISLSEVAELAQEEGEADPWVLAARYAARMLPAIFRAGDPTLELRFAPEGRQRLEALLAELPTQVFTSDDGLGWVYQFWQSEKKKEVNRSGRKIGAAELPAVTQLFTEDYMVRFLLENSLGAWWAARHPASPLLKAYAYLRYAEDGSPAAGTFDGWPKRAANLTVMDPCCGSGHFLTVAFEMLTAMRMEEDGLSAADAGDAVIAKNLFGLEIDPRCTQIAAFAVALAAWRTGGYRDLPSPNIACSGIAVAGQLEDWKRLAAGDEKLERALEALHEEFRNAPELGSLIDPRRATEEGNLFSVDYDRVAPLLEQLLSREPDPETEVAGWAAAGMIRAAALLAHTYTLVVTNPPFLGQQKMSSVLKGHARCYWQLAAQDLATVLLERWREGINRSGTWGWVLPENWLFLPRSAGLRRELFRRSHFRMLAHVGEHGFVSPAAAGAFTCLVIATEHAPSEKPFAFYSCLSSRTPQQKEVDLRSLAPVFVNQGEAMSTPGYRLPLAAPIQGRPLREHAFTPQGIKTGDDDRYVRRFWEIAVAAKRWRSLQSTVVDTIPYGGRSLVIDWANEGRGMVRPRLDSPALGRAGVAVSLMRDLPATIYAGDHFDSNVAPIVPEDQGLVPALWAFASSSSLRDGARRLELGVKINSGTLGEIAFDVERWKRVAAEQYSDGLPEPYSNDPTQWLFKGDPTDSTQPLHVAAARLLGYRWPDQEPDSLDELADDDGAVPLAAVSGEQPAAVRLRAVLERAYGQRWSAGLLADLLEETGAKGQDLDAWLHDSFFAAHTKLFHNRPFIWHIWDGRKDGFGVLVNYHGLDAKLLDRIAHTYLGNWIEQQREQVRARVPGAESRVRAAQDLQRRLELIAEGEAPYDIYVRWKALPEQPIGWNPDLDDGVRLNIRPFVLANVLRSKVNVNWNKDRGKDPDGSERINDLHFTRAEKLAARQKAGIP